MTDTLKIYHVETNPETEERSYVHVAIFQHDVVDVEIALEEAFRATNNINGSWSKGSTSTVGGEEIQNPDYNPNIEVVAPLPVVNGKTYGHRSTSVFDIIVLNNQDVYVVDVFGFVKLEDAPEFVKKLWRNNV